MYVKTLKVKVLVLSTAAMALLLAGGAGIRRR